MWIPLYLFIFSFYFFPSTLFTSGHNKCKPIYLNFASTNFFSSALPYPNDPCLVFLFFLSTFGVSNTPKSTNLNNSCWLLYQTKKKLIIMKDMLIYEHIYYVGWTNGAVHPTLTWVLTIIFWYWKLKLYICIFYAWVIKTIITINSTDQSLSLTLFSSRCQPLLTVFGS